MVVGCYAVELFFGEEVVVEQCFWEVWVGGAGWEGH